MGHHSSRASSWERTLRGLALVVAGMLTAGSLVACSDAAIEGQGPRSSKKTKSAKATSADEEEVDVSAEEDVEVDPGLPDRVETTKGDAGTDAQDSGASPAPAPTPTTTPTTALTCGEKTNTRSACYACCDGEHPSGASTYTKGILAFDACACLSPGTCASACGGNYCAGGAPTAACDACLNSAFTCSLIMTGITSKDPDYQALLSCDSQSACSSK